MLAGMRSEGLCPELVSTPAPNAGAETRLRIAVGIATSGRRAVLSETLREIARQTRLPDAVYICPVGSDDVDQELLRSLPFPSRVVASAPGTSRQRNAILAATKHLDAIVFFDDDYFPSPSYLANAEAILERDGDVAVMTGTLIEDGINGPGLTPQQARGHIAGAPTPICAGSIRPTYGAYGCNMVFRLATVYAHNVAFDENLPLYGWQEDIDFSRQLANWGRVVRAEALTGVHLGVKRGRTSGVRFGYSQVANPIFLMRKGTVSLSFSGRTMVKNLLANVVRAFCPEAHVDRVGRLKGNLLALFDLLRGRLHPRRICELN
jgi:GT2 family glycosyltransferase